MIVPFNHVLVLAGLLFFSILSGESIYNIVSNYVAKNLELTMVLYQNMGMSYCAKLGNAAAIEETVFCSAHLVTTYS